MAVVIHSDSGYFQITDNIDKSFTNNTKVVVDEDNQRIYTFHNTLDIHRWDYEFNLIESHLLCTELVVRHADIGSGRLWYNQGNNLFSRSIDNFEEVIDHGYVGEIEHINWQNNYVYVGNSTGFFYNNTQIIRFNTTPDYSRTELTSNSSLLNRSKRQMVSIKEERAFLFLSNNGFYKVQDLDGILTLVKYSPGSAALHANLYRQNSYRCINTNTVTFPAIGDYRFPSFIVNVKTMKVIRHLSSPAYVMPAPFLQFEDTIYAFITGLSNKLKLVTFKAHNDKPTYTKQGAAILSRSNQVTFSHGSGAWVYATSINKVISVTNNTTRLVIYDNNLTIEKVVDIQGEGSWFIPRVYFNSIDNCVYISHNQAATAYTDRDKFFKIDINTDEVREISVGSAYLLSDFDDYYFYYCLGSANKTIYRYNLITSDVHQIGSVRNYQSLNVYDDLMHLRVRIDDTYVNEIRTSDNFDLRTEVFHVNQNLIYQSNYLVETRSGASPVPVYDRITLKKLGYIETNRGGTLLDIGGKIYIGRTVSGSAQFLYETQSDALEKQVIDFQRNLGNCLKVTGGPRKHPVYTQSDVTVHKDTYESLSLWVYMPAEILSVAHGLWFFMIGNGIFSGNRMGLTQFSRSSMILYWYNGQQVAQVNVLNNQIMSGQWNNITVNIKGTDMADYDVWINGNKKMLNPISSPDTSDWYTSPVGYSIALQGNVSANPAYLSSFMWFNRNLSDSEVWQINEQHGICPFPLTNNLRFYCLFNEKNGRSVKNLADQTGSSDLILYNYTDQETGTSPFVQPDNTVWCDSYTLRPLQ